jgi:hypothetical protein
MSCYKTVREAKEALDRFLCADGDYGDGAHYIRPNGTRGPIVRYESPYDYVIVFAVDRSDVPHYWEVSKVWVEDDGRPISGGILHALWIWQERNV